MTETITNVLFNFGILSVLKTITILQPKHVLFNNNLTI